MSILKSLKTRTINGHLKRIWNYIKRYFGLQRVNIIIAFHMSKPIIFK